MLWSDFWHKRNQLKSVRRNGFKLRHIDADSILRSFLIAVKEYFEGAKVRVNASRMFKSTWQ